jgi:serine/threonine protein phosphatase 1
MMNTHPKRIVAIGDIHGHLTKLEQLLSKIQPARDDQLVFLGDYVDRGPESRGVIDCLIRLKKAFPKTIFLRGNHDQMFLDAMVQKGTRQSTTLRDRSVSYQIEAGGSDMLLFMANGGRKTMKSYGWGWDVPPQHIAFLESAILWWRFEQFLFVHAGCLDEDPDTLDPWILLWSRSCEPGTDGKVHVVGHTPLESGYPRLDPGRYMLDTGCAFGGPLSACDVLTKKIWQAK